MLPSEIKRGEKDKNKKDEMVFPWTKEQEELLAEWAEKAMCYRWLHGRSEKSYRIKNYTFTIPVIILSTLTGTANFAMDSFVPEEHKQLAMAGVGSVNIFAGILSTLQNFLRYAELMESHRLSEVQWSKFGRNIEVELALDPRRRKPAHEFLEICRAEYDRLIEQSPTIDDNIIKQFKRNFKRLEIKVPAMCNGLDKVKIFERPKEEKVADILTNVSSKLLEKKKARKWTIHDIPKTGNTNELQEVVVRPSDIISKQRANEETRKDLEDLKSFSRVSSMKKLQQANQDPISQLHEDIKNQKKVSFSEGNVQEITDSTKQEDKDETTAETKPEESTPSEDGINASSGTSTNETETATDAQSQDFLDGITDENP